MVTWHTITWHSELVNEVFDKTVLSRQPQQVVRSLSNLIFLLKVDVKYLTSKLSQLDLTKYLMAFPIYVLCIYDLLWSSVVQEKSFSIKNRRFQTWEMNIRKKMFLLCYRGKLIETFLHIKCILFWLQDAVLQRRSYICNTHVYFTLCTAQWECRQ